MPTSTAVLTSIIRAVIRYRLLVLSVVAALVLASGYSLRNAALDAIPDISDPQVIIYAKWPRSAELLDAEVADPLIQSLIGSPGIESIRATSHLGYSFVYLILSDAGQRAAVKELALDRINALRSRLPADAELTLGPDASSLGWIYQYALIDRAGNARFARASAAQRKPHQADGRERCGYRGGRDRRRPRTADRAARFSAAAGRSRPVVAAR